MLKLYLLIRIFKNELWSFYQLQIVITISVTTICWWVPYMTNIVGGWVILMDKFISCRKLRQYIEVQWLHYNTYWASISCQLYLYGCVYSNDITVDRFSKESFFDIVWYWVLLLISKYNISGAGMLLGQLIKVNVLHSQIKVHNDYARSYYDIQLISISFQNEHESWVFEHLAIK